MNAGYSRTSNQSLSVFVKNLPSNAFGIIPWQVNALDNYKKLVRADASLKAANSLPSRRLSSKEIAKAVGWLGGDEKWGWMKDLYRIVFGFAVEDAERRSGVIQI